MLNIFKRKNKQSINKQLSDELASIQKDMQTSAEQYEKARQQILKNLELINTIL